MNDEFSIVNVVPQLVLGMRKRGPYRSIGEMIPEICQFAAQNGIEMIGPPMYICHETNVEEATKADKEGNADVEVAVPILKLTDKGRAAFQEYRKNMKQVFEDLPE